MLIWIRVDMCHAKLCGTGKKQDTSICFLHLWPVKHERHPSPYKFRASIQNLIDGECTTPGVELFNPWLWCHWKLWDNRTVVLCDALKTIISALNGGTDKWMGECERYWYRAIRFRQPNGNVSQSLTFTFLQLRLRGNGHTQNSIYSLNGSNLLGSGWMDEYYGKYYFWVWNSPTLQSPQEPFDKFLSENRAAIIW